MRLFKKNGDPTVLFQVCLGLLVAVIAVPFGIFLADLGYGREKPGNTKTEREFRQVSISETVDAEWSPIGILGDKIVISRTKKY